MPPVSVIKVPEEYRSTPEQELLISIGLQASIWSSTEDAKKLRDALCIMLGRPGKAGKSR